MKDNSTKKWQTSPKNQNRKKDTSSNSSKFNLQKRKGRNKKSHSSIRWIVLALSTCMLLSIYYCYDIPSALKMQLYSYMKNNPSDYEVQFGLLYSLYSIPNVILPLCAGLLVDRFGASICLLVFCLIYSAGQLFFVIGIAQQSWLLMDIGRFLLGLGGESFKVANYALLPEWFRGNELAFVNAIASLSRIGNVFVNILSPNLATRFSLQIALLPGDGLCAMAIIFVIVLQYLNNRVEQGGTNRSNTEYELVSNPVTRKNSDSYDEDHESQGITDDDDDDEDSTVPDIDSILETINDEETDNEGEEEIFLYNPSSPTRQRSNSRKAADEQLSKDAIKQESQSSAFAFLAAFGQFDGKYWLLLLTTCCVYACMGPFNNIASTVLLERDFFKPIPTNCQLTNRFSCQSLSNPPLATCPSSSNYQLPLPNNYSSFSPLEQSDIDCTSDFWKIGCTGDYCSRLNNAARTTSFIMSIPFLLFACTAVPLGKLIDKIGHRLEILMIGVLFFLFTHLLLAITDVNAIVLMVGQGLGNVLFITAYWPLLPLIVDKKVYGMAYGLAMSLQNVTYVVLPILLAGVYNTSDQRYIPNVEYCFVVASVIGFLPIFFLYLNRSYFQINF